MPLYILNHSPARWGQLFCKHFVWFYVLLFKVTLAKYIAEKKKQQQSMWQENKTLCIELTPFSKEILFSKYLSVIVNDKTSGYCLTLSHLQKTLNVKSCISWAFCRHALYIPYLQPRHTIRVYSSACQLNSYIEHN